MGVAVFRVFPDCQETRLTEVKVETAKASVPGWRLEVGGRNVRLEDVGGLES